MSWHAIYTAPAREHAAARFLASGGVEALCPTVVEARRAWRGRRWQMQAVRAAAFPRYLIARASAILWDLVRQPPACIGTLRVVGAGDEPLMVTDRQAAELRRRFADSYCPAPDIKAGDAVTVGGLPATVVRVDLAAPGRELRVMLDLLGSRREATVPLASLCVA